MHTIKHMAVTKEVAAGIFGANTALDQKIESSVAWYGGTDINKKVEGMQPEQVQMAQELGLRHYKYLKEKFNANPEGMSNDEIVAAQLYQKVENGQTLSAPEQAKLHTILAKLQLDMQEPGMRSAMLLDDPDAYEEYGKKLYALSREMFYNLTGFDPAETYDADKEKIIKKLTGADVPVQQFGKWIGQKIERFKLRHGDEDKVIKEHRDRMYEDKQVTFKPELEIAAVAFKQAKDRLTKYCDTFEMADPADPTKTVKKYPAEIAAVKTHAELQLLVAKIDADETLGGALADPNTGEFAKYNPEKKAYELAMEEVFMKDVDKMTREALLRELPKTQPELRQAKVKDQAEYNRLLAKRAGGTALSGPENNRLTQLEARLKLLDEAIATATGKGAVELLDKDQTYADLKRKVPDLYEDDMISHLIDQLEVPGTAAMNKAQKITAIDGALTGGKNKKRFQIASVFMNFLGKKL